ncbi:hypothetical protein BDZ94DRAFT_551610 [Collybia nuda]|uniref:Sodium/calcium exchanger membrane region domain-containing protein n=1 Tax=Collybia nuda TaxID=64659 RepID=A0A9P5YHA7_9AGAR|nr:hypothetical protein BDZ94DRAFT_551610 [Collybia nuda]
MERQEKHHRQRALDVLTRSSSQPPSSSRRSRKLDGHSVWSDDEMSTRRVQISGGYDQRFNNVDLGVRPPSTPSTQVPTPTYYGPPLERTSGVLIWSADAESQNVPQGSSLPTRVSFSNRISVAVQTSLTFWQRLRGHGKERVGWMCSFRAIMTYSWLNFLLIFVPISWGVHYAPVSHAIMFMFCFLAIVPLSKLLDYGGEQLALYCGKDFGDLIMITLSNAVETVLALVLLSRCELRLLQSTIAGVVILRLLLIPGVSFLTGGVHVMTQELHPHVVQLNNTLLTLGVLTLLLPATFFGALDHTTPMGVVTTTDVLNDSVRGDFLKFSRAMSMFLLVVYVCSRFYLHNPPGNIDNLHEHQNAPESLRAAVEKMKKEDPEVNPWVCIALLVVTVVLMAITAEFLVSSVQPMRKRLGIRQEWFGLFLLPLISYSADGLLSIVYFIRQYFRRYLGMPSPVNTLAQGRSIDLGIQFLIFWMPLLVIFGWLAHKPISLLFDVFEVAVLLGACFLVNYVTADAKTNWVEGMMMVVFYIMIVSCLRIER